MRKKPLKKNLRKRLLLLLVILLLLGFTFFLLLYKPETKPETPKPETKPETPEEKALVNVTPTPPGVIEIGRGRRS